MYLRITLSPSPRGPNLRMIPETPLNLMDGPYLSEFLTGSVPTFSEAELPETRRGHRESLLPVFLVRDI
jgi:hypothetical protein